MLNANSGAAGGGGEVPSVRVDLGYSTDGGINWQACCTDAATPLYPSVQFGSLSSASYSSHEVSNIWICPASVCTSQTSYSAHLMYFVLASDPIIGDSLPSGCIVIGAASGPPNNLAWPSSGFNPPTECNDPSNPLPSGYNYALFLDLNGLTGNNSTTCKSWGEPAIMVTKAFSATNMNTMYLAVSCLNPNFTASYYIFSTTNLNLDWVPGGAGSTGFQQQWSLIGAFGYSDLPSLPGYPPGYAPNSVTEFDWSLRPGPGGTSTVVAVLTPQEIPHSPQQLGCIALNFTMPSSTSTNPFGSNILASVTDSYPEDSNMFKGQSPGACAYEPASTIGIALVRGLVKQNGGVPQTPPQKEYLIVASGATP